MHIKQIKEEIKRVSKIKDPKECQKELKLLNKKLNKLIMGQPSGNWIYFYEISYEYNEKNKRGKKQIEKALGRMPKEEYVKNKEKIKKLTPNELKRLLEPITEVKENVN